MLHSHFLRLLQLLVLVYVSVAVLYTTNILLVAPLRALFSQAVNTQISTLDWSGLRPIRIFREAASSSLKPSIPPIQNARNLIHDTSTGDHSLKTMPMSENLFLSKAFAQSMHPSNIIPFFYRASGVFEQEDITITTLITSNRFKVFAQLAERYQGQEPRLFSLCLAIISRPGPISVTVHVKNITSHIHDLLDDLHELYTSTPCMSTNVDVHLVIDSFDRQFNTWRNIARLFARTDFVMMLDVDFVICTDFRMAIRSSNTVMDKLREGNTAFVVPAFEYVTHSDGLDQETFPTDKDVRSQTPGFTFGLISIFRRYCPLSKIIVSTCFTRPGL
jgi:hypothetical protein